MNVVTPSKIRHSYLFLLTVVIIKTSGFFSFQFNIKLGRALRSGEHRVKVFQLSVNETEVSISERVSMFVCVNASTYSVLVTSTQEVQNLFNVWFESSMTLPYRIYGCALWASV